MHLKVMKTMAQLPRSLGIPGGSEAYAQAMVAQGERGDSRINPLAAMGLSDDQYSMILTNMVNGEAFQDGGAAALDASGSLENGKRPLQDANDARDSKRSRFEEIE